MEIAGNILIIGNDPKINSGITNYTRPLALQLSKKGLKVHYLFNTASAEKFDFGMMRLKTFSENTIIYHKLINPKGLVYNYDQLDVDISSWFDSRFKSLVKVNKINVIHINELYGFSSSIIKIAKSMNIKVFVTVHDYWWLCPHKAMVDFNRNICEGPSDRKKCAFCVQKKIPLHNTIYLKNNYRIKSTFPIFHKLLSALKKMTVKDIHSMTNLEPINEKIEINKSTKKINQMVYNRLKFNIKALNLTDKVICVSNDVKKTLVKYGVNKNKCFVNHIGSVIASSSKKINSKQKCKNKINFGYIGGVGFYKGVHLIIKAYQALAPYEKNKCYINIHGQIGDVYKQALTNLINQIDPAYKSRIKLHGRFSRNQLDKICKGFSVSIIPSLCADTAPQTIFESFSYNLPIIAPNIGGFPDFVKHMKNGLLFNAGDSESLSRMMKILIHDKKKISIFKKNILPCKTIEKNTTELVKLYALKNI